MALDSSMIYQRTDRGVREVYEKSHQFTQSERLILILLDGRLTVAGLQTRLPSLNDERIERALRKLQDARLVNPMPKAAPRINGTPAPAISLRLEPEAVAQFLEQSDLDPVTIFGNSDEDVASEMARAETQRAAASSLKALRISEAARQAEELEVNEVETLPAQSMERGGKEPLTGTPYHVSARTLTPNRPKTGGYEWDTGNSTQFAITTVNLPDRLDMQEERDRLEPEEPVYRGPSTTVDLRKWMKRLLWLTALAVIGAVVFTVLAPLRGELSAQSVASRLTGIFGQQVRVAGTDFKFSPSPRLLVRGVDVGGKFRAEEVSLLINWPDLWSAIRGGSWVWAEATVAPMTITIDQGAALVRLLAPAAGNLPNTISTIRFESLRVADFRLLPERYEGVLRRVSGGGFGPLTLRQLDNEGLMEITFVGTGGRSDPRQPIDFRLDATRWRAPIGPPIRWNEVRASGQLAEDTIDVSSYSLAGFYGMTSGTIHAIRDDEQGWAITGKVDAANIDLEAVMATVRGVPKDPALEPVAGPVQGTATFDLTIAGAGRSFNQAVDSASIAGPFQVRWATLNGVNLGLSAAQGYTGGGSTRFTDFSGFLVASDDQLRFEKTGGSAGAMQARADFSVNRSNVIDGEVFVELGRRTQAPFHLRIRGNVSQPKFGR